MERQEVKLIGSKVVEGCFEELLKVFDKGSDCLTQKQAIYLIVCCCNTCNSNINNCNKLNEQKLIAVVKGLSIYIKNITSEEYDSYLQSIFFICKLLSKKSYSLLLELENEILPKFIPKILTEKQKNVYKSICDLVQNEIVNLTMKKIEINEKKIIFMGRLLSKIILKSSNNSIFLEYVFKYGSCLHHLNIDLTLQYDYFLYNISKMEDLTLQNLPNGDLQFFKYGIRLYSTYLSQGMLEFSQRCIDDMLSVLPKEWGHKEILNICKYIIDPNANEDNFINSRECLIKSFKLNRKSENFQSIYKLLSQVMVSYSNFCKGDEKKIFADPKKHMIIYEILGVMIEIFLKLSGSCMKECKCSLKSSPECSDTALCILILFSTLLTKNDVTKVYIKKVRSFLEKYFENLVQRKLNNCEAYKKCWSEVAPYLYNVGVLLFRKEKYEEAVSFVNMTLKYHSLLGIIQDDVVLPSTFNLLDSIYLKQKKFKEALIWSAVEIINTKKTFRSKIFNKWIKIKAESREEPSCELQEFTIISITKAIPSNFVCYIEQIETKEAQIDLLISELEVYHVKWRSKIPMLSSFRHLCQIADKRTIMRTFVQVFTDEEIRVHEDVIKLLKDVFGELENSVDEIQNEPMKLYFSFYYFFQYKHQTIDLMSKNLEEMDKIMKLSKNSDSTDDVIPADAFDRCDVVSAYENLRINGGKLSYLETSLKVLETIVLPNLSMSLFGEVDPKKVYELTKNIVIEFVLHSDEYNTLRSLFIAFNLAEFLKDECLLLECSGYFLRYLNYSDLEVKMEQVICKLENDEESYKYLLQYYLNLSYFHLSGRNIAPAYQHYKNAKKYWGYLLGEKRDSLWCIEVGMELLLFKLMNVARSLNFKMEMEFSYGPLMKAYNLIVNRYTTETQWTTYSMVILFEVFETLIKMYHDLKMPREVRCFGKQSLALAQQYLIPVFSAKILSYLAYADLWSEKFDDCRVKLDGISDILLLEKTERCPKIMRKKNHLTLPSVDDIMEGINEMMLDNPTQSGFNVISSPSSPVLQGQAYRCPFFLTHTFCECFHCTSSECQKIVLSRYHLEALWYMHKRQITLADSFFKGTFKLCESLMDKRKDVFGIFHKFVANYSKNISKADNEALLPFDDIKMHASISYTKFLTSSGAEEAANKFNKNALKKFTKAKIHHPHLYSEMLLQRIALLHKPLRYGSRNTTYIEKPVNNECDVMIKTPEACGSKMLIPKINSPRPNRFLHPKMIKFNLADSESDATPSKMNSKPAQAARTPKPKILPPSLRNINTPNMKTPSQKKKLNTGTKSLVLPSHQNSKSEQDQNQKSPLSEISEPSVSLCNQQATNLKGKTKLLTSRLRKENNLTGIEKVIEEKDILPTRRSRRNRT